MQRTTLTDGTRAMQCALASAHALTPLLKTCLCLHCASHAASKAQLLSDLLPGLASVIDSAAAQASPAGATRAAAAAARAPTAAGRMKAEDLHASLLPAAVTQQAEAPASDLDPETRPAAASGVDASSQASSSSSSSSVGEPSLRQLVSAAFRSQRQATAAQQQVLIDQVSSVECLGVSTR